MGPNFEELGRLDLLLIGINGRAVQRLQLLILFEGCLQFPANFLEVLFCRTGLLASDSETATGAIKAMGAINPVVRVDVVEPILAVIIVVVKALLDFIAVASLGTVAWPAGAAACVVCLFTTAFAGPWVLRDKSCQVVLAVSAAYEKSKRLSKSKERRKKVGLANRK